MARPYLKVICFLDHNHCAKMGYPLHTHLVEWWIVCLHRSTQVQESKGVEYDGKDY